jgi:hypothetical protein
MSDAGGSGAPEGGPAPAPAPPPVPQPPPLPLRVGAFIVGMFLILFGTCLLLAGGSCTILLILEMGTRLASTDGVAWILIALAVAAVGVLAIIGGIRLCGGRRPERDRGDRSRGRLA